MDPKSESIGGFSSGTTSDDVISKLGEPDSRPARVEEGASGEFVVSWKWQAQGILLEMASPSADGPLSVRGLSIRAPSQLKTSKGIGIGASRADVERAYQGLGWKAGDDGIAPQPNEFLIGTVYGGTRFRFDGDAKVESIEVGAWAE
ncbi:MAG: hypothetical protein H6718_16195 [Polyangiaceae bacterium]|nr:hypothetical protein [Myxococcales bacterium]MCB9586940.1 hypothetical protein [Polyangiaceae bacterium]MCB9608229.1 hypothetical protein [Polyangiaceae bacterium]